MSELIGAAAVLLVIGGLMAAIGLGGASVALILPGVLLLGGLGAYAFWATNKASKTLKSATKNLSRTRLIQTQKESKEEESKDLKDLEERLSSLSKEEREELIKRLFIKGKIGR